MARPFEPFANESDVVTIGDLSVENRLDRVSFHGSVEVTRDREGLAKVRALKEAVDAVAAALSGEDLPAKVKVRPARTVKNPFA